MQDTKPNQSSTEAPGKPEGMATDIKIFLAAICLITGAILAGAFGLSKVTPPPGGPIEPPQVGRHIQDFVLTERSGAEVSRASLSNKFLVVNFIHTSCSISCAEINRQMAEIQRLTARDEDVQLVSLSIDPRSDTPPALIKFADRFGADPDHWFFLTGDKPTIYGLIEGSFLDRGTNSFYNDIPGGFMGIDRIVVVDRAGRVCRFFDGMRKDTAASVTKTLQELRLGHPS